jgi:hypothetical protein
MMEATDELLRLRTFRLFVPLVLFLALRPFALRLVVFRFPFLALLAFFLRFMISSFCKKC